MDGVTLRGQKVMEVFAMQLLINVMLVLLVETTLHQERSLHEHGLELFIDQCSAYSNTEQKCMQNYCMSTTFLCSVFTEKFSKHINAYIYSFFP